MLKIIPYIGLVLGWANPSSAQSLLWKISSDHSEKVSYLYGTIHLQNKAVFMYDKQVDKAIEETDALAVEAFIDEINPKELQDLLYMKKNKISEMIEPKDFELLDSLCQAHLGSSAYFFNKFKPLMLSVQLSTAHLPKEMPEALDLHLLKQARKAGKDTYALEQIKDQIGVFNKLSEKEQAKILVESIRNGSLESDKTINKMLKAYLKADLNQLNQLIEDDSSIPEKFQKALILKRNKKMSRKIHHLLKKQSVFIAVGAGHLAGEKGLIQLLKDKGYQVEAVKCSFRK